MTNDKGEIIKSKGEGVSLAASPVKMVKDGQRAAKALMDVIRQNPRWAIKFGGNKDEYLVFEAWQTVAQFFGCAVDTSDKPEYKQYGDAQGFEAVAKVIDKKTGLKIGGATALCMNDEKNWSQKPLFQLESMAQTRAGSKALRNQFSWVVVLAGYKATPAEEMMGVDPSKPPLSTTDNRPQAQTMPGASEKQIKLLKDFVAQGRIDDQDFTKISIKEASELIDKGFKTKPTLPDYDDGPYPE